MKKLGIVVAMEVEAKELIKKLNLKIIDEKNNIYSTSDKIGGYESTKLIISGIGMENSVIATQFLILKYNIDCILNFGYVGSNKIKIGSIVSPNKVFNKDFDLRLMGYKRYQIPKVNDLLLDKINEYINCVCYSANHFVTESDEDKEAIYDMELHGIAMVCDKYNVNVSSIKIVTDCLDIDKYNENEADIKFSEVLSNKVIKYLNK